LKQTAIRKLVKGAPLDPLDRRTRRAITVIPLLAWAGLGADSLSSSCYGPEQAFLALGPYTHLGLYLALATALTVFIVSIGYNQVIELFPSGGGGYKVATSLIGPRAGLVSGAALLIDYVLTIATSLASGADAFFSLLPVGAQAYKLTAEVGLILAMMFLNFRGMKESILILLPVFAGFIVLHALLIVYGLSAHAARLPALVPDTVNATVDLSRNLGWAFVAALVLRAYSLGGGTYTGVEALSNNLHMLAEPRVANGKRTMLYMALSLAFTAGGIILLYVLWEAKPVAGQTLNAVVFRNIIDDLGWGTPLFRDLTLALVLALEAGLLLVAAQTGFLDGPAVLSNMAADYWVPRHFRELSDRLVRENGVIVMGAAALAVLVWTQGQVAVLVVLYSINVFLTFSLSKLGLCIYWWRQRGVARKWLQRLVLSALGLTITASILVVTLIVKFTEGGWLTMVVTGGVVGLCLLIKKHYAEIRRQLARADALYADEPDSHDAAAVLKLDTAQPTAVLLVGKHRGASMHALLWVQRLFPGHFRNFVFLAVGEVDAQSYAGTEKMQTLRETIEKSLRYYTGFCRRHGLAAEYRMAFGTDPLAEFTELTRQAMDEYPNSVCFASKLIFTRNDFLTAWLHNKTPLAMQDRLHLEGRQMIILPMKVK